MNEPLDLKGFQKLLWDFAGQRVVTTAGRCGILSRLAAGPAKVEPLAAELRLAVDACDKVVRALVALGVCVRDGEQFRLAPALAPAFAPGPNDMEAFVSHTHDMYDNWGANLEAWLRTGTWPRSERSREDTLAFAHAMRGIGLRTARQVVDRFALDGVRKVLDIGGSLGHWAEVICERLPQAEITVFDVPVTAAAGREYYLGTELAARISFVGGDYLADEFPPDQDMVLIASVLHQELAAHAAELVRRAAAALAPGGRLCVVDFVIDADRCGPVHGALFAINMRDFGDTWTEADIRSWMAAAGLVDIERQDVDPVRWLISGRRPV